MLPIIASIISGLIANGLPKVADAVIEKGVDYVQDKMGIELKPESLATKEDYAKLQAEAMKHEAFMAELDLKNMEGARWVDCRCYSMGAINRALIYVIPLQSPQTLLKGFYGLVY